MGRLARCFAVIALVTMMILPVAAAQEPGGDKSVICNGAVFIMNHFIGQPAWVDTQRVVAYAFHPVMPSENVLYWHGDLHFAGMCEVIEQILECIAQKLESGGDVRDCLYWPDWPA